MPGLVATSRRDICGGGLAWAGDTGALERSLARNLNLDSGWRTARRWFGTSTVATSVASSQHQSTAGVRTASRAELEIKDPAVIFGSVWMKLEEKYGRARLQFPKEIIWLIGAPGAGKGTNTPFILRERGITAEPLIMSSLLTSPEAERLKASGKLVSDSLVLELLFEQLLLPIYKNGVVVDGFPRTNVQVEMLKLLHDQMLNLRTYFSDTPLAHEFRRPKFRVTVLFVEEAESVRRQLRRGLQALEHNQKVKETGIGELVEERPTDFSEEHARARYLIFKNHYAVLWTLKEHFNFTLINASGTIEDVEKSIREQFAYQSSFDLAEDTYDAISRIPVATETITHARQWLVKRLDNYQTTNQELLGRVVEAIQKEIIPSIQLHAFAGDALIKTSNELFDDPLAVKMALDVLSERGYHANWDLKVDYIPTTVNLQTGEISVRQERLHVLRVKFNRPTLRKMA